MFCPKCGTQLPDGSTFCSQCGNKINAVAKSPSSASPATSSVPRARASASFGATGVPLKLTPGKIVPLVALGIVFILSFFPWVDLSTIYSSENIFSISADMTSVFHVFGAESSYSLWSLPSLGDLIDAYQDMLGYSSTAYGSSFMGILWVFIAGLVLAAIGAVLFVVTDRRLLMNVGLMLLFVISGFCFLCFVLGRSGGVIPVILFSALSSIVGIIGSGLDATK